MIDDVLSAYVRYVGRSGQVDRDLRSGSAVGLHFLTGNSDQGDHSRPTKINNDRNNGVHAGYPGQLLAGTPR